jgi:formylglycine-generating enzyme required for sulfatase activity
MPAEVEMQFAWVPPGWFLMGDNAHDDEKPVHRVEISKGFYLGIYPVTQAQWAWVMGSNNRPSHFTGEDRPVEQVSWEDCLVFCARLRELTNKPIRLPTEAEWEYACRAGTTTDYYSGNGEEALKKVGWYKGNSNNQTQPVGKKEPNAFGLFDLHGNVWEWCLDWHAADYYGKSESKDPEGPKSGSSRMLRGGSWRSDLDRCRAAYRRGNGPAYRSHYVGVRVCFRLD